MLFTDIPPSSPKYFRSSDTPPTEPCHIVTPRHLLLRRDGGGRGERSGAYSGVVLEKKWGDPVLTHFLLNCVTR